MGRQIQLCTTDSDNKMFENFLISTFNCTFFKYFAPDIKQLEINSFSDPGDKLDTIIFIWNRKFPWTPQFGQTTAKDKYYISNTSNAPLIEFSKTRWTPKFNSGRIYWSKFFTADPIEYDLKEFEKFYDTVSKWFIKHASGKIKYNGINLYYLKEAWERNLQNPGIYV